MEYSNIYMGLQLETAIITFVKRDGSVRVMLGTHNMSTIRLLYGFQGGKLGGHDKRCDINNGNISVYDMDIGDARSFSVSRVVDIQWLGEIKTQEDYDKAYKKYIEYKNEYEKTRPKIVGIEDIK